MANAGQGPEGSSGWRRWSVGLWAPGFPEVKADSKQRNLGRFQRLSSFCVKIPRQGSQRSRGFSRVKVPVKKRRQEIEQNRKLEHKGEEFMSKRMPISRRTG